MKATVMYATGTFLLLGGTAFGTAVSESSAEPAAGDRFSIDYVWRDGHSPYQDVRVSIADSGTVHVAVAKHTLPRFDYGTSLSRKETDTLREWLRTAGFFTRPAEGESGVKDGGEARLTARVGEQERTLSCRNCRDLEPLTTFLWRLVYQAEAIWALERDADIYQAAHAVNPRTASGKALQPGQIKDPLLNYLQTHNDRQRVEWVLEALAFVTAPDEFRGIVEAGVKNVRQRDVWLTIVGSHPFHGNIPVEHRNALCPLYLAFASEARLRQDKLTKAEAQALSEFTQMLAETRYAPAIPVLKTWFEAHRKPYVDASFTPLAKMGAAGVEALIPYLNSAEEYHRLNAAELLTIASRCSPRAGFANPLPDEEYARMIPLFTKTAIPRLEEMSRQDASPKVRAGAIRAVEEINRRIRE